MFNWGRAFESLSLICVIGGVVALACAVAALGTWIEDHTGLPFPFQLVMLVGMILFVGCGWGWF